VCPTPQTPLFLLYIRLHPHSGGKNYFGGNFEIQLFVMNILIILTLILFNSSVFAEVNTESFFDGAKTIHIKFMDTVDDKYTVDVLWNPDDGNVPRLVGPAVINFVQDSGYLFSVSADAFHLSLDTLNDLGLLKIDENSESGNTLPVDLTMVYPVKYNSLGKISLPNNTHHYDKSRDSAVPFFFEDIDFDNKNELIIVNAKSGQRWSDSYTVYKPTYKYGKAYNLAVEKPFDRIDQHTTFDKENRTIDIFSSGGACTNSNEKFKLVNGKYVAIEFTDWDYYVRDGESVCVESNYVVVKGKRVLKSKSESYTKFGTRKTIELGVEYY